MQWVQCAFTSMVRRSADSGSSVYNIVMFLPCSTPIGKYVTQYKPHSSVEYTICAAMWNDFPTKSTTTALFIFNWQFSGRNTILQRSLVNN